ncbi:UDP-galactose transporter (LPG5B) [Leptomonas seymouri]|uniref:UDP-galactose transporter (LPG5B) n=1 Tax=Leptomonas seymouri TaxID=5684 RepID=A0A0N1HVQ8_LEPSE|nr:UDP-galactose transporter (LPG5B) [Leptomonas seymouri]|eukprot:KPI84732.1 UDP-galactose transporter (LPG5B) [Leptomonas seymouri]
MQVFRYLFSMAAVSLIVLVVQNSLLVVMTRFSRKNVDEALNYYTSTLVLNQECVKMVMCLVIYAFDDVQTQFRRGSAASLLGASSMCAAAEEVGSDVLSKNDASLPSQLRNTKARVISLLDDGEAGPFKESKSAEPGEDTGMRSADELPIVVPFSKEEPSATAPGSSTLIRRNLYATAQSLRATGFHRLVGFSIRRKHALHYVWMQTRAAVSLYCTMLRTAVVKRDTLKLLVPAFLFNLQNFLIFVGLSNLDAMSFQVWSQTKLLFTAFFSVSLLHRKLSPMQWLSLVTLTAGVLGAQLGASKEGGLSAAVSTLTTPTIAPRSINDLRKKFVRTLAVLGADDVQKRMAGGKDPQPSALLGIGACVLSGFSSSYAGVYFEKVVKTTSPTLSIRNIQLSMFAIPLAFASMLLLDVVPRWNAQYQCGESIQWNIFHNPFTSAGVQYGVLGTCPARPFYFWQRYDQLFTWALVGIHALGGLLVAIVMKYADNILKGFATGVAVIVSGLMSSIIWGYTPTLEFVLGSILVIGSSIVFHKFEPKH